MAITHVAQTTNFGSPLSTIVLSPTTIGNLQVLSIRGNSTTIHASSIAGGGCTTWTKAQQFTGAFSAKNIETWYGVVTSTAASQTATITWSSAIGSNFVDIEVDEFTSSGATGWTLTTSITGEDGTNTTTPAFPTLSAGTGGLYYGYMMFSAGTLSAGTTSGYSYVVSAGGCLVCYNGSATGSQTPAGANSTSSKADTIGAIFTPISATVASAGLASVTAAAFAPTATASSTASAGLAAVTASAFNPTAAAVIQARPGIASVTAAAFNPSATGGTGATAHPGVASVTASAFGASAMVAKTPGLTIPLYSVQVSFTDPYDTPDWVDITKWVKSGSVKRGRQHELQRAQAGTCALTTSNQDGRFSTFNANSPYVNIMTAADSYFQDVAIGDTTPGSWGNAGHCTLNTVAKKGYDGYAAMSMVETGSAGVMTATTATGASGYAVTANSTYGFQVQVLSVAFGRSVNATATWYTSGGTLISTSSGTQVTSNLTTYTKATLTATAPSNAAFVAVGVSINSSSSGDTHYVTRVMISNADQQGNVVTAWAPGGRGLVPARPVQVQATDRATAITYPVYYGYTDSFVPAYSGPVISDQVINCTDGMNLLALAYITSTDYQPQCAVDGALGFWYFGDMVGSQTVADSIGSNPLSQVFSLPLPTFGQPILLGGDTHSSASVSQGQFAENAFSTYTAPTAWTLECVINTNTLGNINQSNHYAGFVTLTNVTGGIQGDQTGVAAWEGPGGVNLGFKNINDGVNHHLALTVTSGGVWKGYVDGVLDASGTGPGPSGTQTGIATGIGSFNSIGPISFDIAGMVYTPSALSAAQVAVHAGLAMAGFVQQQSGQRITAILNVLGVPSSLLNIATGISAVQAPQSSLATTPSLSYIETVENTEQGFFYVDESGNFVFRDRHYTLQNAAATTSNGTFANDANSAHFKYLENSIIPAADALDLWNDAPVSATANAALGVVGDIQDAPNTDSERWYGRRTIQGYSSMLQTTDTEALSLSQWLVAHYGLPVPRVRQMKLDSTVVGPSSISQMLGRKLWDNITVVWQPMDGTTSPFVQASLIENIQHDFSPDLWTTTWGLSVAETQDYFILNSATNGTLAAAGSLTGNRLAY